MGIVQVTAKKDFIESLTSARPIAALAELIWNGFDAKSNKVEVFLDINEMDGLEAVRVRDYGQGIVYKDVDKLFGSLGDSWKKAAVRLDGRSLHGKNGKGRFKAFALGSQVEWATTYRVNGKSHTYKIVGKSTSLDNFDIGGLAEVESGVSGTEVTIHNVHSDFRSLKDESAQMSLAKIFAVFLTEYPEASIEYDGKNVDPGAVQSHREEYELGDIVLKGERKVAVSVVIIEWSIPTERIVHLCDSTGISLYETPAGQQIRAPGFHFTAYIKSDHFRELDKTGLLALADLHDDVQTIIRAAKSKMKEHFRRRLASQHSQIVEKWKQEQIYPYEDSQNISPVEYAERQVFDILAVNVQSYLPSFEDSDIKQKKFTFFLLAQAIRQNPDSVQFIIGEVLGLRKEAQDDLALLLEKTPLSSIISSAKVVANRLDMLNGLEALIFDKESKKKLLERDQLHKILETESWLFHEEFALAGSEQRLEEVLRKHLSALGPREDDTKIVDIGDGKTGRVDLMLQKVVQPRTGHYDYLVVELKRPSQKINADVLTQIKKYAFAVASDERFAGVPATWTFIAISNELDSYAKKEANQRQRPRGQVHDDSDLNLTVWVKEWAEVINDARSRLRFVNEQLSYEADRDSAKAYLQRAHAKFIPEFIEDAPTDDTSEE
ncbi:MAG: ATP-binding protein [Pseudomonadota bacterium]